MLIAIVNGPEGEHVSEFDEQPIVVGRQGTLRLADRMVSKRHAQLRSEGGEWIVEDLGSTNGTFINGARVDRPCRVKEGDKLELGSTVMVISMMTNSSRDADPPVQDRGQLPAPADGDPLAPWLNTLPAKRDTAQPLASRPDESVLSIRPLAQHETPSPAGWRRMLPYLVLTLVLFAVTANLLLLVLFRRDARQDARELREALARQEQAASEAILREVREELRAPSPQQLQAWQELGDSLVAAQATLAQKLQEDIGAQYDATAARQEDHSKRTKEEAQAAVMRELTEIKEAIAGLKKAAPSPAPQRQAAAIIEREPQASPAAVPAAAATVSAPAATPDQKPPHTIFLIDASGALQRSVPEAVAEVRRTVATVRQRGAVRVLLLYQGRLIDLPGAALEAADVDPIDRGPADLATAIKAALADRPPVLYLFSDTLGDVESSLRIIRQAQTGGTSIHVTQFFSRDHREQLKSLARDHHGNYSFIAPAQ